MKNDFRLSAIVDQCAALRAQIDQLTEQKRALEAELIASGEPKIEGTFHVVSISRDVVRDVVDWKSIAAKFEPSRQLVTAHTSQSAPCNQVRYSARKLPE